MPIIRGILFNLGYAISSILFGTFSLLFLIWLPFNTRYQLIAQWVNFVKWWLKITCGITHRVTGLENLPSKPCVIVSNHQSTWETFFLQQYFSPQSTVLKKELLMIPFFGWVLRFMRPIVIDRSKKANAIQQIIKQGKQHLNNGLWVLIFPEGTRVPVGETKSHYPGAAMLAAKAEVPIVPLVHNAGLFWPAHSIKKYPGVIDVVIGQAINTDTLPTRELNKQIELWINTKKAALEKTPQT